MTDQPHPPSGGPRQGPPPPGPPPWMSRHAQAGTGDGGDDAPSGHWGEGRIDAPLHPLLPGGGPARTTSAHHEPHAASAGPADGARGAMWFALGVGIVVLLCLVGLLAILS